MGILGVGIVWVIGNGSPGQDVAENKGVSSVPVAVPVEALNSGAYFYDDYRVLPSWFPSPTMMPKSLLFWQ